MARPSTREKLLDCAELLFAEQGLAGVSLRSINARAGLSPAALHYHFGSKDALVAALLDRHMPQLMERRRRLLDALEDSDVHANTPAPVRSILDALVRPMVELLASDGEGGHRYLRLIYRLQADGDLFTLFPAGRLAGGVDRLAPMLCRALPEIPPSIVEIRLTLVIDIMLRSLALTPPDAGPSMDEQMCGLLDFLTGALEAPCTDVSA